MTSIEITILKINPKLISAFALLDSWLDRDGLFQRADDGSTMLHQLEHILFTNQILLHEIAAGVIRANILYEQGQYKPGRYKFEIDNLKTVLSEVDAGKVTPVQEDLQSSPDTLRLLLRDQLYRCMEYLDRLASGQGRLVTISLPVNGAQQVDLYQALYFVAMQMQKRINKIGARPRMDACSTC